MERELNVLKSVSHENIVGFLGQKVVPDAKGNNSKVHLVMEVCQGDLKKPLQAKGRFSSAETAYIMRQILEGLEHLHGENVIHR